MNKCLYLFISKFDHVEILTKFGIVCTEKKLKTNIVNEIRKIQSNLDEGTTFCAISKLSSVQFNHFGMIHVKVKVCSFLSIYIAN